MRPKAESTIALQKSRANNLVCCSMLDVVGSNLTIFKFEPMLRKLGVTWKIREYANFVSNLLAYVISVVSP